MSEVVMTPAMLAFSWPEELRHAPSSPDEIKGGFQAKCRCGYPGKWVKSSPSHAYQATRVHAENENRREGGGGVAVAVDDYTNDGEPPKRVRPRTTTTLELPDGTAPARPRTGARTASRGTPGTPCGCGCGEPSGGLFRPGHDSKLLSRLLNAIRGGQVTLEQAHAEMVEIGTSEVLREKLAKKLGQA